MCSSNNKSQHYHHNMHIVTMEG